MTSFLQAPYPNASLTITLPSPEFGNDFKPESRVNLKRSMLGRIITYVNASDRQTLSLTWELTKFKAIELQAFLSYFPNDEWLLILHDGSHWRVNLRDTSFVDTSAGRRDVANTVAGTEFVNATLNFSAVAI